MRFLIDEFFGCGSWVFVLHTEMQGFFMLLCVKLRPWQPLPVFLRAMPFKSINVTRLTSSLIISKFSFSVISHSPVFSEFIKKDVPQVVQ